MKMKNQNQPVGAVSIQDELAVRIVKLLADSNLTVDDAFKVLHGVNIRLQRHTDTFRSFREPIKDVVNLDAIYEETSVSQIVKPMDEERYKEVLNETLDYLRNTLDDTYLDDVDKRAETIVMLADKLFALDRKLI